jgi:peptidoglycan/xylan/chitin deacetylase (PgdA/CDA1 family)
MYHRVAQHVAGLPSPLHNVHPKSFAAQLEGLLRRGFRFVPLRQALHAADHNEPLPPRSVVVTFDDGFGSVYTQAWPVMKRLDVPATVFVNTAYLDSDEPFPFDAWGVAHRDRVPLERVRPLRTDECREMMQSGLIEIGAHTHTHEDFRGRPDSFREDLALSVRIVRELFGVDDVTFAFPYGSEHAGFASDELCAAARAAGVRCGLTTKPDVVTLSDSPFRWGRFNVFAWDTSATLAAKLGGWYGWAPAAKQAIARKLKHLGPSRGAGRGARTPVRGERSP